MKGTDPKQGVEAAALSNQPQKKANVPNSREHRQYCHHRKMFTPSQSYSSMKRHWETSGFHMAMRSPTGHCLNK